MMAVTHVAIALAGSVCITGSADPRVLLLAGIGSQIPDLDTTKSWVGLAFFPLARFIEERYPHRSVTHSICLSLAIALLTLPVLFLYGWQLWLAMPLGHLLSCFSDCFTRLGCQFFWPINKDIWVGGLNPRNRLQTGKPGEYAVLASAVCIFCIAFYVVTGGGGVHQWVTQVLFPTPQTAVELLRQENQKAIAIKVEGNRKVDGSLVNEIFWAIAANGSMITAKSATGEILRVGEAGEISPKRVDVLADRLPIKIKRQQIEEAEAESWINSLSNDSLIVGTLQLEDAADLELPLPKPGRMQTVNRSVDGVVLDHASKQDLRSLDEFFILSGEVIIKQL
ncbi:hypothetical protein F7734_09895 [Scytonema sp. UIC 10036]|uniref:metal-dependent hydrolase n=1 Tax=Scytonema sp. UIC 10036 TaxID=2304196 RepID=UPI0012DA146B|nr:metal-dependent hydrolase [Scytonema sp. UIC 10036]MUG92743.1 hypothetical protein [Scytonema sp. UIC 10036]